MSEGFVCFVKVHSASLAVISCFNSYTYIRLKALLIQLPAEAKDNPACQSVLRKLEVLSRFMKQVRNIIKFVTEIHMYICCADTYIIRMYLKGIESCG